MSELEENMSAVVLWIRCTFIVLCIYAGAMLYAGGQMLRQWLSHEAPPASARETGSAAVSAPVAAPGKVPGNA
jgi:hypothetical protein